MYGLYVDDKFTVMVNDLKTVKKILFVLAVKGHKVAYKRMD